jgi:hypothetical protein
MNCKPGDLAVMCRGPVEEKNVGIMLRVLSLDPRDSTWTFEQASRPVQFFIGSREVGAFGSSAEAGGNAWVDDRELRPIRDNDGDDETLTWAGKPEHVTA